MIKHNIGNKVKVIDEESAWFDNVGFVSHFDEDLHWNVFVRFPNNETCNFRHKELTPIK